MTMLSLTVPLHPDETPTSFCSRLAFRNGCDAHGFCLDMGFKFLAVATGEEKALAELAAVSGADPHALRRNSFTSREGHGFQLRGQMVNVASSLRTHVRVCPDCISEDVAAQIDQRRSAPFQRIYWQLSWFRSCPVHGVALLTLGRAKTNMIECADFARAVAPHVGRIVAGDIDRVARAPSSMEVYLYRRLNGEGDSTSPWLDSIPMHKAVRLCEIVGAVSRFGPKVATRDLDDEVVADVASIGCDIMLSGEELFRGFVRKTMAANWKNSGELGGKRFFGLLYDWLRAEKDEASLNLARDAIREEVAESLPVGELHTFFDVPIGRRRCWSVTTVATACYMKSSRMRQYLSARGLITAEHENLSNDRTTFPAEKVDPLIEQLRSMVPQNEAMAYLGMPRSRFLALMREGLVVPFFSRLEAGFFCNGFLQADLDNFLKRLSMQVTMPAVEDGMVEIFDAAKRCRAPYAHVMRILLEGGFSRVAPWPSGSKCSLAVDPNEVRRVLAREAPGTEPWPYLTVEQIREQTKWGNGITWALISKGLLPHAVLTNPVTTRKCAVVHRDDLESFCRTYVTFGQAAKELGTTYLRQILRGGVVKPAIKFGVGEVAFYLRADFQRA
ncbi:TniQ family protein [Niveispirillum fermenti]|uniref:TniQ family protein n=1 Tax=Niveispirillum fermenti TaxID=1233113 RepID=UPI004042AF77